MYLYEEVEKILIGDNPDNKSRVKLILEDDENPIRGRTVDKLYSSIETMGHVDFGSIEKSAGDVKAYSGYSSMMDTLGALQTLGGGLMKTSSGLNDQVKVVMDAINALNMHSSRYKTAYSKKVDVVILEYNTLVACCVEATTSLLYNFADFMRNPRTEVLEPVIKNSGIRGSLFYIDQLRLFNRVANTADYRKYLDGMIAKGKENFVIDTALAVGSVAVITTVALSIVPIIRKCVYTFQDIRRRLTDALELQAYFLELNRTVVEARSDLSKDKKDKIIKKQEELRLKFVRLADKIRVQSVRLQEMSTRRLDEDNRRISLDNTQKEIDDSDIVLF